jgi:hypothetical protein
MRKKLMLLATLTCALGGAALTAPTPAEAAYPSCEYNYGKRCSGGGMLCTHDDDGTQDTLVCWGGTYVYA